MPPTLPILGYSVTPDQVISDREKSIGFNLGTGVKQQFQNVTTFMESLWERLRKEPAFAGVDFHTDYPTDPISSPRVIWKLDSRVPGLDGKNRLNAFLSETWPTQDGTIIWKYTKLTEFTVTFEILATQTSIAENIKSLIEVFLETNPYVAGECGAKKFFWERENSHTQFQVSGSQNLKRRSISYHGQINQIYAQESQRIQVARVWTVDNNDTKIITVQLTRALTGQYDEFPVLGPISIVSLHTCPDKVVVDYVYGTDFQLVSDEKQYDNKFFVVWIPQGKNPLPGATYYASYISANPGQNDQKMITETRTEITPFSRHEQGPRWRQRNRSPITPQVLGQQVSPQGHDATVSQSLVAALAAAQANVVSVIDPSLVPGIEQAATL